MGEEYSMDMTEAEHWISEAGNTAGIAGEFEALQGVMVAQTARYQWIGEGNISELYPWYVKHLVRLHERAQRLAHDIPFHVDFANPNTAKALVARIRAILSSLPEVSDSDDESFEVTPV